jgi:hypothetical protein
MNERGWAAILRKRDTDFGSGFRSAFGSLKALASTWRKRNPLGFLSSFARSMNVKVSREWSWAMTSPGYVHETINGSQFPFNQLQTEVNIPRPGKMKSTLEELLGREVSAEELDMATEWSFAHELFEAHHFNIRREMLGIPAKAMSTESLTALEKAGDFTMFSQYDEVARPWSKRLREAFNPRTGTGSHMSMAVIGDEALYAASRGEKHFRFFKELREREAEAMYNAIGSSHGEGLTAEMLPHLDYIRNTRKVYESVERKWLPRLSGKLGKLPPEGAAFNPISGLHPGDGLAKSIIQENTPFGSMKDRFKMFLQMSGLQKALTKGTFVKALGAPGGFGKAELFKTLVEGKEMHYVKKTLFDNAILGEKGVQAALESEASAMAILGGDYGAPTLYGTTKKTSRLRQLFGGSKENAIFMEYIPGQTLEERIGAGQMSISPEQHQMLRETVSHAAIEG